MELTAYNEATEPDRIERLARVNTMLRTQTKVETRILQLHDDKGTLSVNWGDQPTAREIVTVARAWERQCEWAVNHYVRGVALVCDVDDGGSSPFS